MKDIKKLNIIANTLRQDIIKMISTAGSGHPAGSLGMADVFTALYFNVLKHDPKKPDWPERDILVLSNGHICPARYAAMAHSGYFPVKELMTLRKFGSRLQGHPHRNALPGLETTSGPLGCGISQAAGMALALRMDKKPNHVYCITSDGEHDEGNTWEGIMFANKMQLSNLTVIIDRNNIQIDGHTEEVMPLEPLREKYEAFGWHVIEIDGHNMQEIIDALENSKEHDLPTCIIAHTTPGKGVSFMENDPEWHGKAPNEEQTKKALQELEAERKKLEKK
ncbi:MAG: transketolase [Candidatus Woesearchaeota archaeon]